MQYLIIALHISLFCYLILNLTYFKSKAIHEKYIIVLYLIKVFVGFAYNYLHANALTGDAWSRANDAMILLSALPNEPLAVFQLLFLPESYWDFFALQPYITQFSYPGGYSTELPLIKTYFIGLFFSGGNFYGVIPFFAFILLYIGLEYYALFTKNFGEINPILLLGAIFFIPSAVFFTSGLYKDGIIYIGLGLTITNLWKFFNLEKKANYLVGVFIGLLLILMFRWVDVILYLPVVLAYIFVVHAPKHAFLKYVGILTILLLFTFLVDYFVDRIDLLEILYDRKTTTKTSMASSRFESADWRGVGLGLIFFLPQALIDGLFRPFPWDVNTSLQLVASIESTILFLFFLICILFRKQLLIFTPLMGFLLFTALIRLIFNGLLIENSGTIIRHRSEILMYLVVFFIVFFLDEQKFNHFFTNKKFVTKKGN